MAELFWFPWLAKEWLSSPVRMAMLPEQRGAYVDLLCVAWGRGDVDPSLPNDDAQLAAQSGLGIRWKKLGPLIRAQFEVRGNRLVSPWLSSVWLEQQGKHAVVVEKASKGGRAKAEKLRAKKLLEAVPQVEPEARPEHARSNAPALQSSESERAVERGPYGPSALPALPPDGALSAGAPRASGGEPPKPPATPTRIPGAEPLRYDRQAIAARYLPWLTAKVLEWRTAKPANYQATETEVLKEISLPLSKRTAYQLGNASEEIMSMVRAQIIERVRLIEDWPDVDGWVELEIERLTRESEDDNHA